MYSLHLRLLHRVIQETDYVRDYRVAEVVEVAPPTPPKAHMALINNMAVEDLLCLHLNLGQMTGTLMAHQQTVTNFPVTGILHINKDLEAIDDLPPDSGPKADAQTQDLRLTTNREDFSVMLSASFSAILRHPLPDYADMRSSLVNDRFQSSDLPLTGSV